MNQSDGTNSKMRRDHGFTNRQWDILLALLAGQTEAEYARKNYLSRSRVSYHVSVLKKALGARTAAQVVHRAWCVGLVDQKTLIEYGLAVRT